MSKHKELLHELEMHERSAVGVEGLMAHICQRLHEEMARYNWVGFYVADASVPRTLFLGPYVGSFLPLERVSFDVGLCGAAASNQRTVVVNNVATDLRYVSATTMVKSELVVPVMANKKLVAEIDVESYFSGTFTENDQEFVESCAALVGRFMERRGMTDAKSAITVHQRLEV
jgi:putative methionine-R-sulfoxide reductase with GAF domain